MLRLFILAVLAAIAFNARATDAAASGPCLDRAAQVPTNLPPRLSTLSYTCLALNNKQHVLVGRTGTSNAHTVLLVHGMGHNAHRDWVRTIEPLAQRFHVIAVDLPGFGSSPNPAQGYSFEAIGGSLNALLEQVAPGQRVHVVGHSMGGAISLYFAHRYPDKVDRLVLANAAGILFKSVYVRHIVNQRTQPVGNAKVDRALSIIDQRVNALLSGMDSRADGGFDFTRWLAQNPGVRNALLGRYLQTDAALGLVEHDFTAAIRDTKAPTTVIWGSTDNIAPLRTGTLLAARLPDARLRVLDGVGHMPMHERPDDFNRLLLEALAEPLAPKQDTDMVAALAQSSQGHVYCRNTPNRSFRGRYESLTLENCLNVRIENAYMKQLKLVSSSAAIDNSVIDSADIALDASNSRVTATAVQLSGRVAVRADNSFLDLAGASVRGAERNVEQLGLSRVFFSVSDLQGADFKGDAHLMWPSGAATTNTAAQPR